MVSKQCFKCKEVKLLCEFYTHPMMSDGHVNKCKECNKRDVVENRKKNAEYYQEYDRRRGRDHNSERYQKKLEYGRRPDVLARRHNYPSNTERRAINIRTSNAIRDRRLLRPDFCHYCGIVCTPDAHHPSYAEDMWDQVVWLCKGCHGIVHREYD